MLAEPVAVLYLSWVRVDPVVLLGRRWRQIVDAFSRSAAAHVSALLPLWLAADLPAGNGALVGPGKLQVSCDGLHKAMPACEGVRVWSMRVVVDLTRCQGYAQCAFHAPAVFRMHGEEALMYDLNPDDAERERVLRAAAACPVEAIQVDRMGPWEIPERSASRKGHLVDWVKRIVIVGASLAGLEAAERLREEGFSGSLTVIGDEPSEP